ncbi:hypothetical protein JCM11641_003855 [Rhodosporidiobolus odoratus]
MVNTVIICKAAKERAHEFVETVQRKALEAIESLSTSTPEVKVTLSASATLSLPLLPVPHPSFGIAVQAGIDVISPSSDESVGLVSGVRITAGVSCAVFPIPGVSIPS